MNASWVLTGGFLAGVSVCAVAFVAAERCVRAQVADSPQPTGVAMVASPSEAGGGAARDISAAEAVAVPSASESEERWATEEALVILGQRVATLEAQLADSASASPMGGALNLMPDTIGRMDQSTLVAAGVDPVAAAEILRRQNQVEMQRLELRDRASREGWLDSERFIEQMRELSADVSVFREEIGDEAYDRFLYLTGKPNRVIVASVIDESPAQLAGVETGDHVLGYGDRRIFRYSELRSATLEGMRGEYVLIRVKRNGETLELSVPRGPLGLRLDSDQIDPDSEG